VKQFLFSPFFERAAENSLLLTEPKRLNYVVSRKLPDGIIKSRFEFIDRREIIFLFLSTEGRKSSPLRGEYRPKGEKIPQEEKISRDLVFSQARNLFS
jgi:hypothetical protein